MLLLTTQLFLVLPSITLGVFPSITCGPSNPCPKGQDCHPHENICYDDPKPVPNGTLHVWLGDEFDNCDRKPEDCSRLFGLQSDGETHPRGDVGDQWCEHNQKVRCITGQTPPLAPPTPVNYLEVISYNVFERQYSVTWDGQRERTCRIPDEVMENWATTDVIVFQEAFNGGCWLDKLSMRDLLTRRGMTYFTKTVDCLGKVENGGIFIASRWPILEEDQMVFQTDNFGTSDWLAAKGVSYAKIEKTAHGKSRIYHVMGTHLNTGKFEIGRSQAREWASFINRKNISPQEPLLLAGDFNVERWSEPDELLEISKILSASIPSIAGDLKYTSWADGNDVKKNKGDKDNGWIDYVMYSQRHLQPSGANNEALVPFAENAFPVCWCELCINLPTPYYVYPDEEDCPESREIRHLSDHQPVRGRFHFP